MWLMDPWSKVSTWSPFWLLQPGLFTPSGHPLAVWTCSLCTPARPRSGHTAICSWNTLLLVSVWKIPIYPPQLCLNMKASLIFPDDASLFSASCAFPVWSTFPLYCNYLFTCLWSLLHRTSLFSNSSVWLARVEGAQCIFVKGWVSAPRKGNFQFDLSEAYFS